MAGVQLEGRRVVVVGATGGLGRAIATRILAQGGMVLGTGRANEGLTFLESHGATAHSFELFDRDAPAALAHRIDEVFGGVLDGLVVAAATQGAIGPTRSVKPEALMRAFKEGPVASLALVQACAPQLDRAPSPSLVFLSGGGAAGPFPRYTPYALSKVALVRLVENLAAEEPDWKVNAVAPGFVATGIHSATLQAGAEAGANFEATRQRLKGGASSPEATAALVAFLLARDSDGISGRLVSAIWDDWADEGFAVLLREDPTLARLRRVDGRRVVERRDPEEDPHSRE